MSLFNLGEIRLHSGERSKWKIDCDALTDEDIKTLAYLIAKMVGNFSEVYGVPTGGLRIAEALKVYLSERGPVLLVDDVLTTGNSLLNLLDVKAGKMGGKAVTGAVIFARGPCPEWVRSLFQFMGSQLPWNN